MKHAGEDALDRLEPLLAQLRGQAGIVERKRGSFYRKGSGFLHFHEDPAGLFADLKLDGTFQRYRATTRAEQRALLRRVRSALAPAAAKS
jgi:hypothetical protein